MLQILKSSFLLLFAFTLNSCITTGCKDSDAFFDSSLNIYVKHDQSECTYIWDNVFWWDQTTSLALQQARIAKPQIIYKWRAKIFL